MFRATIKSLLSRKLRLALSGLAVVLGVMFVSGAFVLTDTLKGSFDSMFTSAYADTDVALSSKVEDTRRSPDEATPVLPASLLDKIRKAPGVSAAEGEIYVDGARLIGRNGKVVTTMGSPRFGTNWRGEDTLIHLREGRGPKADNEIAINAALAKAGDVKLGDTVGVLTTQPKKLFTIVGIIGYAGGKDSMSSAHEIAFTTPVAQELMLGKKDVFTNIRVRGTAGTSQVTLRDSVRGAVGDTYKVQTRKELEATSVKETAKGLGFLNKILLAFAAVALFVGTFLIVNTFSIIIAQRTRELALMRAIGASRKQIISSILIEATAIGLLASALGLAAGIGVGGLLGWVFGNITDIGTVGLRVPVSAAVGAFGVGVPITVIAALLPAVRASRIAPVAAMHEVSAVDKPLTRITIGGAVTAALGGGLVALGLNSDSNSLILVGVGALVLFLGVSMLAPSLARPVASLLGKLMSWSVPGRLGRLNSHRNPRRTAITAAALMIGIALVTGMTVITSSVNSTLQSIAEKDVKVDLFVDADWNGSGPRPTLNADALDRIGAIKGVDTVVGVYDEYVDLTVPNGSSQVTGLAALSDVDKTASMWSLKTVAGTVTSLRPDQVIVDEQSAKRLKVSVGNQVTVEYASGQKRQLTVAGIYKSDLMGGWMGTIDLRKDFQVQRPVFSFIDVRDGASIAAVRKQVDQILADSPELSTNTLQGLVNQATSQMTQVLRMIQILLGLAILIAVLGIVNTLALSIIERTRELGMLRAIGLRRAQMVMMITVESIIISVFGAILGMAVGSGLGAAIVRALKSEGITQLTFPFGEMGIYLLLAAVVGVIAAIVPAIRAARVNVLGAIATA